MDKKKMGLLAGVAALLAVLAAALFFWRMKKKT